MTLKEVREETPLVDLKPQKVRILDVLKSNGDSCSCEEGGCPMFDSSVDSSQGVTLAWRDLSVYVDVKTQKQRRCKRIINGATGAVKGGSLVALMGSSGAGKSTLMSALAHRTTRDMIVEGDIVINGRKVDDSVRQFCAFMEQDDVFFGTLTVLEHMNIMARLKLDRRIKDAERKCKIYSLLEHLGLNESVNTRIGFGDANKTLSGGERKRLALATELLTDPSLLFCDEPTTGLDSYSAQKIARMMNMMAAKGKTIICTIHQPSSDIFANFSQVILLADGRIAFMGSVANALEFFNLQGYVCPKSYNPADFFIKTLSTSPGFEETCKQTVKRMCDRFAVSDFSREVDVIVQYEFYKETTLEFQDAADLKHNFKGIFWWTKLQVLVHRWFLEIIRNPSVQTFRIAQKIGLAIIIGMCYAGTVELTQAGVQSVQGAIFLFVSENTFTPMYSVLAIFPQDSPIFHREYRSGLYSTGIYYVSKIVAMLPCLVIEPLIFISIAYWMVGLRSSSYAFLMAVLTTILTLNVSIACGIFFSNAFDSVSNAMAYLVPFDYVLMVTSGLFIRLSTLPSLFAWTKYLSWLMYSTEVMSILQWEGVYNISCEYTTPGLPCLTKGDEVLEKFNFSKEHMLGDLWSVFALCVVFHALGFLCLWWRMRRL